MKKECFFIRMRKKRKSIGSKAFIERACGRDEKLLKLTGIHGFFMAIGFMWLVSFIALGLGVNHLADHFARSTPAESVFLPFSMWLESLGDWGMGICAGVGAVIYISHLVTYATTHVGLTDRRLLLRTGLINVNLQEIDLDEIKSEHINHGLLGRFLGYGEIKLDARFVENFNLPRYIPRPYDLLRAIHEARSALVDTFVVSTGVPPGLRAAAEQSRPPAPLYADHGKAEVLDETEDYVIYKKKKA